MAMPFQCPSDYVPAVVAPEPPPRQAWWFVFRDGDLLVASAPPGTLPRMRDPSELGFALARTLYLGALSGVSCFCGEVGTETPPPDGWAWQNLRMLFGVLEDSLFALAGRALQLLLWDRTNRFCGACGTPTRARATERARECPSCGLLAYPRLSPAIMCLPRRGAGERGQLLLARSPHFPQNMYSALAGFVEPGEPLEQCIEREVREEVGIQLRNLRYFASQPWPFPHSLMIAFHAEHAAGEIRIDAVEIEDARWFDLSNLPRLPARISVARRLIDAAIGEMLAQD